MRRSLESSQQHSSLNDDLMNFIEEVPDQNEPENFYSTNNKKSKIHKSKRMLTEEILLHSSLDEPLSSVKSDEKKENLNNSFSDSLSKEEFNFNTDAKKDIINEYENQNQFTYTKKIIDFSKPHCKTQPNSERKKFVYYYRYNQKKKHHFEDEEYDDDDYEKQNVNDINISRPKKIVFKSKNIGNTNDFNFNSNNNSKISSINIVSSADQNKLNEFFSSPSSKSPSDNQYKKFKSKKSEINYDFLTKEESQMPRSFQLNIEKPKHIKKKVIKKKFKKNKLNVNPLNINEHKTSISNDIIELEKPKIRKNKLIIKRKYDKDKINKIISIQRWFKNYLLRKNKYACKIQSFWRGANVRNLFIIFRKINYFKSALDKIFKNNLSDMFHDFKSKLNIEEKKINNSAKKYQHKKIFSKKLKTSKPKPKEKQETVETKGNDSNDNNKFEIDKKRYEDLLEIENKYKSLSTKYEDLVKKYSDTKENDSLSNDSKNDRPFRLLGSPSGLSKHKRNIFKNSSDEIHEYLYEEQNSVNLEKKL